MANFHSVTPELAEALKAIVGEKRFQYGDKVKEDYSHDEMPIYGKFPPEAVCEVETTEEVSAILKLCNENNIPVTARGAGTSLTGASVPIHGGVVVCTARMNKILSYDIPNMAVTVQPGVLLQDLAADVDKQGLYYPPDPGSKTSTVGGNVATNAGGMRAVKYGSTRDYVLALTVVLASGEVMHLGKTVCKTSTGYSLLHLMIGSEGTLGIITEMTLKLVPKPAMNVSVLLPFERIEDCIATVPKIRIANLDPQSIEFMGIDIVNSSSDFTGKKIFPTTYNKKEVDASILVTFVGENEDELYEKMEKLDALATECGAIDTLVIDTPTLKTDVWAARSAFLNAIEGDTKILDELDVVVPVDQIANYLAFVRSVGDEVGLTIRNFGHAGDGNLHIYACTNDLEFDEFWKRNKILMAKCYTECKRIGGQLSGEHGIGHAKKEYLEESVGEVPYRLMKAIKALFDPNGILNPGKVCS
ncbi:MAG: FAD-binding protein [Oscillospiraceae bacterium]|jgi:glycolate oxidase|nr:FAD-binding protein [Oscillospiraceae bacterium]